MKKVLLLSAIIIFTSCMIYYITKNLNDITQNIQENNMSNAYDSQGLTPLMQAIHAGDLQQTKKLIVAGANLDEEFIPSQQMAKPITSEERNNLKGIKAIHFAAVGSNPELIKILLDAGAHLESTTEQGMTPLIAAAADGRPENIQLLLSLGANVNAQDNNGNTALMHTGFNVNSIEALLGKNANKSIKNKKGQTAYDMVIEEIASRKSMLPETEKHAHQALELLK